MRFHPYLVLLLLAMLAVTGSADAAKVRAVRTAAHDGYSRIVIELDQPVAYAVANLSRELRTVTVVLQNTVGMPMENPKLPVPWINNWRADTPTASGQRLHFYTSGEMRILDQKAERPFRIVLDLYPPGTSPILETLGFSPEPEALPARVMGELYPKDEPKAPAPVRASGGPKTRPVIVIDPGHGGHHKGGLGRANGRPVSEKEITLAVGLKLEKLLQADPRFDVRITRRNDVFISLQRRVDMAEEFQGDLFVSIHTNAAVGPNASRAKGLEFWTWNREGTRSAAGKALVKLENDDGTISGARGVLGQMMLDALESQSLESRRLATSLERGFLKVGYFRSNYRGQEAARFKVLENYMMPSVLIELGFITNPDEVKKLVDPSFQQTMAKCIYDGIVDYWNRREAEESGRLSRAANTP